LKGQKSFLGHGKVLVMDDGLIIREVAGKMLKDAGFIVEKAANGEDAVQIYKKALIDGIPIDVVILDLTVPGGMGARCRSRRFKRIF